MAKRLFKKRRRAEKRRTRVETLCGIAVTAVIAFLYLAGVFRSLEFSIFDWMVRLRGPVSPPPEIVVIEMDQGTIDGMDKWPVPRDVYARLLDILTRAGARLVGFNIMFTEESSAKADAELAGAIRKAGMVYLPYYLEADRRAGGVWKLVDNIAPLKDAARGEGQINMPPDADGVVRRAILDIPFEGKPNWQLAFRMACDRLGVNPDTIEKVPGRGLKMATAEGGEITIPLDAHGAMLIDWYGRWRERFPVYSIGDLFESERQEREGLAPRVPLEQLKGSVCLVGLTMPGTFDAVRTPYEQVVPSIGVHAAILSQVLQGRFIRPESRAAGLLIIVALGLCVSFLFPHLRPAVGVIVILGVCVLYLAAAALMLFRFRVQPTILYPLATLILVYLTKSVHHEITISLERARLHYLATHDGLTGLYVVGHMRLLLAAEIIEAQRRSRNLSVIMADIDHFKKVNDDHGHQVGDFILKEVAELLKSSCRELDIVGRYGGEEFIVVLPDAALEDARGVAERIRKGIEAHVFSHEGEDYSITISLGAADYNELDTVQDIIKRADAALYEAKRAGRNCVRVKKKEEGAGKTVTLG